MIGWGGFIFQFWIPTYLTSLGPHNLESMGALSALPWAVRQTLCNLFYLQLASSVA